MLRFPCTLPGQVAAVLFATLAATSARAQILAGWPNAPHPPGNPTSAATGQLPHFLTERLGAIIFCDVQMSTDNTVSCLTCHRFAKGGTDDRPAVRHPGFDGIFGNANDTFGAAGVVRSDINRDFTPAGIPFGLNRQATGLKSPTMIGAAFFEKLFWDKRATSPFLFLGGGAVPQFNVNAALESQASGPPVSSVEMGHDALAGLQWPVIEAKLGALFPLHLATNVPASFLVQPGLNYQQHFDIVFGPGPITREKITQAIAAYMRTLIPNQTPFDLGTMTASQQAGFTLFQQAVCTLCHPAPFFSDGLAHNIQLTNHNVFPPTFPNDGFGIGVKTPTLRNVGLHNTFFHSGHITSLQQAMNQQFLIKAPPLGFAGLNLTAAQIAQVIDFMANALTDPRVVAGTAPFESPTLHTDLVPHGSNLTGPGSQGTGGLVPLMIGNAPANIGFNQWRLGLGDALPGALAELWFSPVLFPGQTIGGVPVELDLSVGFMSGTVTVQANGTATVHQPVPFNPGLIGLPLNWQWFVRDPAATGGFAASRASSMVIL